MTRPAIIYIISIALGFLLGALMARAAYAHVPLKLLADVHCMVETQHKKTEWAKDHALGKWVYLPYLKKWERAVGRCQILPSTARWLAERYKWDGPYDLELKEHSKAFAHLRFIKCGKDLRKKFGRAPQRSLSWCYLSGQVSLWSPRRGFYAYYLDEIERKLEWVRRNRTNWMAWTIIKEGDRG
ncbi:MAG: hypothetical protein V3V24_09830 [Nitrospinaceae bacterium]